MGIVEGGNCIILAGAGPMGLGAIDYAINGPRQPKLLVVTDIDEARLARAATLITPETAAERGVELIYVNTANIDAEAHLLGLTDGLDMTMSLSLLRFVPLLSRVTSFWEETAASISLPVRLMPTFLQCSIFTMFTMPLPTSWEHQEATPMI